MAVVLGSLDTRNDLKIPQSCGGLRGLPDAEVSSTLDIRERSYQEENPSWPRANSYDGMITIDVLGDFALKGRLCHGSSDNLMELVEF